MSTYHYNFDGGSWRADFEAPGDPGITGATPVNSGGSAHALAANTFYLVSRTFASGDPNRGAVQVHTISADLDGKGSGTDPTQRFRFGVWADGAGATIIGHTSWALMPKGGARGVVTLPIVGDCIVPNGAAYLGIQTDNDSHPNLIQLYASSLGTDDHVWAEWQAIAS